MLNRRERRRLTRTLSGLLLTLLCAGPVINCECDSGLDGRPELEVDLTALQFDDVAVGFPQIRVLTISNVGRAGLVFNSLTVRGGDSSPFALLGSWDAVTEEVGELPGSLGLGGSIQIAVNYDPLTEDAQDFDVLEVMTNDRDECPSEFNQCEIQLSGTGAPPDPDLAVVCQHEETCPGTGAPYCQTVTDPVTFEHPVRVSFNFCDVAPGSESFLKALLHNAGNVPLTMDGFILDDGIGDTADFRLQEPADEDIILQPGQSQMMTLVYSPAMEGFDNTGMDIFTNDEDLTQNGFADGTFSVRVLANAASPNIQVSPVNIPFTGVSQGEEVTETITVNNTGSAILVVSGLEVTGGSVEGEFYVDSEDGFEVGVGGQGFIDVTYAPSDSGADDGSIIIYSNDPDEASVTITLGGAVRPDLDVTPFDVVQFLNVPQGGSDTQDVNLRNVGHADLTVSAIAFSMNPGDPPVFSLAGLPADFPANPIVLAPTESHTFQVDFLDNTMIEGEIGQIDIGHDSPNDSIPYILICQNSGTAANLPPVADVQPRTQTVNGLDPIHLDGSGSFDPDVDDSVSIYSWSFLFKPQTPQGEPSEAFLDSSDEATTSFTPDIYGEYIVRLVVFDTFGAMSQPFDASISVSP